MKKRYQRRSGLFLIELILNIAFFSITSCICVQFFAHSRIMAEENRLHSEAELMMDNVYVAVVTLDQEYLKAYEANPSPNDTIAAFRQTKEGRSYLNRLTSFLVDQHVESDGYLYLEQKSYYIKTKLTLEESQNLRIESEGYRYGDSEAFVSRTSNYHIPYIVLSQEQQER